MLDRILQNTARTVSSPWGEDGAAVDPGVVTVTITRADGTAIVTGAATAGTGTNPRTYNITAAQTALLDNLALAWVSPTQGTRITHAEIVGGFCFSVAQARNALGDQAYDPDKIAEARTYAETELENAVGYALVPRYALETKSGRYQRPLRLRPYLRTIRSASVNATALSASELSALTHDAGLVYGYCWPTGHRNVVVGYEHGLDFPPAGASKAALGIALDSLGDPTSTIDPRAESIVTVDGTIRLRTGGQFSAGGVNEWIAANRIPTVA